MTPGPGVFMLLLRLFGEEFETAPSTKEECNNENNTWYIFVALILMPDDAAAIEREGR